VSTAHLPALQPGRTYQLWVVLPQRPPIGAGVFDVNASGSGVVIAPSSLNATLSSASNATFAITNEPAGGSPAPTTDILIAGKLGPS
jgi:anti-sigma-K factor RskA